MEARIARLNRVLRRLEIPRLTSFSKSTGAFPKYKWGKGSIFAGTIQYSLINACVRSVPSNHGNIFGFLEVTLCSVLLTCKILKFC